MEAMIGTFAVSLVVGAAVGVLSGLLGIGGGTLLVPVFKLGYALDSIVCTATSLFTIIPTSVSGAVSHIRNKTCLPRLGIAAGLGGALTSPLGVWLSTRSPDWAVMGAAAIIIAYSSFTMFKKALKAPKTSRKAARRSAKTPREEKGPEATPTASAAASPAASPTAPAAASPTAPAAATPTASAARKTEATATTPTASAASNPAASPTPDAAAPTTPEAAPATPSLDAPVVNRRDLGVGFVLGFFVGIASGYVGVGGGFILVPLMISVMHVPMRLTSGTSLIAVMILAVPGVITQAFLGNVNWLAGIAVACGSIPGAAFGARLVPYVPERTLRFMFAGFLIVAAILLVVNQIVPQA